MVNDCPPSEFKLSSAEMEIVRGVLHALQLIRSQSGYGNIKIEIADNQISTIDIAQNIRPNISAPWHTK